jgi:glycosyltransferase involved in cell wall biosynthesis
VTVAVVIPCRNEQAHIGALLDAIAAQTRLPDDVVIVDDGSTDETRARIAAWGAAQPLWQGQLRIVDGPGRGPGPAMNTGIRATQADSIVRLDGHCVPEAHYIERSCRALERPEVGVVGGMWRVVPGADTHMARAIAAVVSHPAGSGGVAYRHAGRSGPSQQSVDTVPFGAFRRDLWQRLDGYDEALTANEDYNFNYRTRRAGLAVVLDRGIVATYSARPTLRLLWRQYQRYGYWKAHMLRKDPRALTVRQIPPALLLPWLVLSVGCWIGAVLFQAPVPVALWSRVALVAYPSLVLLLGLQVGLTRRVLPLSAAAALVAVHLAWSVGVWRAVSGFRS